jgi:hypothetical protein
MTNIAAPGCGGSMRKKPTVEEDLRSRLGGLSKWYAPGTDMRSIENGEVAKNVLHEELGYFSDGKEIDYNLDEATRDRLITHGRQDAAHALGNTISLLVAVSKLEHRLRNTQIAIVVLGVIIALLLALRHVG